MRVAIALFVMPLLAAAAYYGAYALLSMSAGAQSPDAFAFIALVLPAAYIGVVVLWLPFVLLFQRPLFKRNLLFWHVVAGSGIFLILSVAATELPGNELTSEMAGFLGLSTLSGGLFGLVFWAFAFGAVRPRAS